MVRGERGDHVRVPVAVDVRDEHLRSALAVRESERVERPRGISGERRGLREPAVLPQDVGLPVPVDVADAEPVREAPDVELSGDRMERPRRRRIAPVRLGVANRPSCWKTRSGTPSRSTSAYAGDSLSTEGATRKRSHGASRFAGSASGFRYQNASFPGKPTTTRSSQPSPSRSRGQTKKLSE
jgi:hypothetical protein